MTISKRQAIEKIKGYLVESQTGEKSKQEVAEEILDYIVSEVEVEGIRMTNNSRFNRIEALKMLSECQEETTSISLEIGKVKEDKRIDHNALIVTEAPPRIVKTVSANYKTRVTDDGLEIVGDSK